VKPLVYVMLAIAMTGGTLCAAPGGKGVFPYATESHTLENGLRVILIPMSGGGLMSYYSIVRTGSRDEYEPGKTGFAHFFEHMMFRGTKNYPAALYDRMVTGMGADANAYTTDDLTAYHLAFASQDLETVVKIESDRFQHLEYDEGPFQTEAGAVYGEYRKNRTNPWEVLFEALQETAFTTHTYGHTTMGYEADIKAMPTLYGYSKEFFDRYYRPENVVLLLAGDFDPNAAMTLIRRYYGAWKKGYVPPKVPVEPEQTAERRIDVRYDGRTLPLLVVAYKGERLDPSDRMMVAGSMLADLLFGETSDIYRKLVLREQTVQSISANFGFNRDPGLWNVYAVVKDAGDLPRVLAEIDRTIAAFRETTVDERKLANLKKRLKYSFLMNLDTPGKVAGRLARFVAITGGIDVVDALYAAYDAVTAADLRMAAERYLVPERRTVATLRGRD
jgi:zinc protease